MGLDRFARRVISTMGAALGLTLLPAFLLGGPSVAVGAFVGGATAVLSFVWLARAAAILGAPGSRPCSRVAWIAGAGGRHLVIALPLAASVLSGWTHPFGLAMGLCVLPVALVVIGLREAGGAE